MIDPQAWRYFGRFFKGRLSTIALSSVASIAHAALVLPTILLIKYAFDVVIPQNKTSLLILIGIAVFLLNLLGSAIAVWVKKINIKTIHSVIFAVRADLLARLFGYSRSFYTDEDLKIVHTRIVEDTERLNNMSNALISKFIPSLVLSFMLCAVLVYLNGVLFVVLSLIFPALFFLHRYMGTQLKKKVFFFQRAFEAYSRSISFSLRFMELIKLQTAERKELQKQTNDIKNLADTSATMHFFYALNGQMHAFITGLSGIVVIIYGGVAIAQKSMSIGDLFAFYMAVGYLYRHVAIITDAFMQMVSGNASMITLSNLAASKHIQPEFGSRKIDFSGAIALKSVSFQYNGKPILQNIDFHIQPGTKVVLTGDNGTGKTTLINLILGLYKPTTGTIEADGIAYENLDIRHLRKSIAVVTQNPVLFSGTVRDNILYGSEDADLEDIGAFSGFDLLHDVISGLPQGCETHIGEEGSVLSGGQRQKLAIVRALLRRPRLLILDEPTNHLDKASIGKFIDSLDGIAVRPAVLIVSHDSSVAREYDAVLRLENGVLNDSTVQERNHIHDHGR